jgi:hypothetical protein
MDETGTECARDTQFAWRNDPPAPFGAAVPLPATDDQKRISELDGLSGLEAVAIVVFHSHPSWLPMG